MMDLNLQKIFEELEVNFSDVEVAGHNCACKGAEEAQ